MEKKGKCAHQQCRCSVRDNSSKYCCKHCEKAANEEFMEIVCECGHNGCGMK